MDIAPHAPVENRESIAILKIHGANDDEGAKAKTTAMAQALFDKKRQANPRVLLAQCVMPDYFAVFKEFSAVTSPWKLVICAHGNSKDKAAGVDGAFLGTAVAVILKQMGVGVSRGMPRSISLVICGGGKDLTDTGLVWGFLQKLSTIGFNGPVTARTENVTVNLDGTKATNLNPVDAAMLTGAQLRDKTHQVPGSKLTFRWDVKEKLKWEDPYRKKP